MAQYLHTLHSSSVHLSSIVRNQYHLGRARATRFIRDEASTVFLPFFLVFFSLEVWGTSAWVTKIGIIFLIGIKARWISIFDTHRPDIEL